MRSLIIIIFALLITETSLSQTDFQTSTSKFQYGIGAKLSIDIGFRFNKSWLPYRLFAPSYKLSLTAAVGYEETSIDAYPAIHSGILIFNKNSIGANQSEPAHIPQFHWFINSTLSKSLDNGTFDTFDKLVPFYHFTEFTSNPLQNPYNTSLSFGVNIIGVQNGWQRVGFFSTNIMRTVQFSYYNDGGPILGWPGDNRDRYYTGGGQLTYHGKRQDDIDLIEISYHKFTGYHESAFDVADKLQIDILNPKDLNQMSYNQQRWKINMSSAKRGWGGNAAIFNLNRIDFQDMLHFRTDVPYHPDYYQGWRIVFGITGERSELTLNR